VNLKWVRDNPLRTMAGVLVIAALTVTLTNNYEFAMWFEGNVALAWAYAVYVDLAIVGYTLAQARDRGDRTVRFAFWWFIGLSLLANVAVTLDRYDIARSGELIREARRAVWFMFAACGTYGVSIPISVYTFAHTVADGTRCVVASAPRKVRATSDLAQRVRLVASREPRQSTHAIARELGVSDATVRKYRRAG